MRIRVRDIDVTGTDVRRDRVRGISVPPVKAGIDSMDSLLSNQKARAWLRKP
jgi:hypothetical protein